MGDFEEVVGEERLGLMGWPNSNGKKTRNVWR